MPESLEELAGGEDQLLMPPANPAAPPQAVSDAISTIVRNSETPSHSILNTLGRAGQHTLDWIKTPGKMMEGAKPATPGRWTEEDEFRAGQHAKTPYEWGPQTALGMVFDPVPALAARLAAPAGSYALRNMKRTPVEGNPFVDTEGFVLGSGATPPKSPVQSPAIVVRLNESLLANEGKTFPIVFGELKELSAQELKQIAKEFTGQTTSSKTDALKKIWNRHQQMEIIRAKNEFMKGRSAG